MYRGSQGGKLLHSEQGQQGLPEADLSGETSESSEFVLRSIVRQYAVSMSMEEEVGTRTTDEIDR